MKHLRDILGYLLGLVLFVGLMPTLMWLASGIDTVNSPESQRRE